jgi:hypothetical protein
LKTFELLEKARNSAEGESILGYKETGSHACYMLVGVMKQGEKGRRLKPGAGHEELVLAAKGSFSVTGFITGTLAEGHAIHLAGEQECLLENISGAEAVYVLSGGHSESGHH